jgi:hypothetical protein
MRVSARVAPFETAVEDLCGRHFRAVFATVEQIGSVHLGAAA